MDCFDPFKDYLELAFLRPDVNESESPISEDTNWMNGTRDWHNDGKTSNIADAIENESTAPEDIGWMNGTRGWQNHDVSESESPVPEDTDWMNGTRDWHNNGKTSKIADAIENESTAPEDIGWMNGTRGWQNHDGSHQWTPGSSSDESNAVRPLLGRRVSTVDLPNHTDLKTHPSSSQSVSKSLGSASTAMLSSKADGVWGHECGAWIDMNSEINSRQTTACNRNRQTVGINNGLYSSTGFFSNSDASQDTACGTRNAGRTPGESPTVAPSYPRYSSGFNVEHPEAVSHVAILLNRLMQQGTASVAEKNGFRNFNSLEEGRFCAFCKKNRERREFYVTHVVKDSWGKVICPILRKYICPICRATGDNAHTLRHCPVRANHDLTLPQNQ